MEALPLSHYGGNYLGKTELMKSCMTAVLLYIEPDSAATVDDDPLGYFAILDEVILLNACYL
jgi:hypothetical protein